MVQVHLAHKSIIKIRWFIRIFGNTFEVGFHPKTKRHLKAMWIAPFLFGVVVKACYTHTTSHKGGLILPFG